MIEELLNQENRKVLRENITQILAMFLILAFASSLVLGAIYIVFRDNESLKLPFHTIWIFWFSIKVFFIVYGYFIYKYLKLPINDFFFFFKKIQIAVLCEKRNNIKYTYHANTIVDFKQQPVLNEYFFKFDDFELQVNKEDYNNYNQGDTLLLSFAYYSNRLIQLEIFNKQS